MIDQTMSFFTITIQIFILLNSYAQIPVFLALLANFDAKRQKVIIAREMIIALITLIIFIVAGYEVLAHWHSKTNHRYWRWLFVDCHLFKYDFPKRSKDRGVTCA
jgi:small neutral amino acid transporter SnatA (MarC family)